MIDRPNYKITCLPAKSYFLGDNNLKKEFYDCFSIILSSCYEDDTRSARYFNKIDDNGTSSYYVHQEIENSLQEFLDSPGDTEKFLIGFTGIGKTTLIKNYFRLNGRPPFYTENGDLITYLSVYTEIINTVDDLEQVFVMHLRSIVAILEDRSGFRFQVKGEFIIENINKFYEYAVNQKGQLVNDGSDLEEHANSNRLLLKRFESKYPIDYYALLITYLLSIINSACEHPINKLVLIYDDIESQAPDLHLPFIAEAQKIAAKIRGTDASRSFSVKNLISLRNYTFRYNYSRYADAMRSYPEDVILKDSIPKMKDIFQSRFKVYYDNEEVRKTVSEDRWKASIKVLDDAVNGLAAHAETIAQLANCDISHSLKMFMRVLTNHRWFAPSEEYYNGAYSLESKHYDPVKDRTIKALLYGESDTFLDNIDNILPNILRYHTEEKEGIELLPLYVMEYMLYLSRRGQVTLYGVHKITGKELCNNIINTLNRPDIKDLLYYVIEQLYKQRCLLQSIFEHELPSIEHKYSERKYHDSMGLYLSFRGNKIMELLKNDSLLFEIYRDDIDTDLPDNAVNTASMSQKDRMIYLIKYCEELFYKEKKYIMGANKVQYFRCFGGEFIVSRLVRGLKNSFYYYFKNPDSDAAAVRGELKKLTDDMANYGTQLKAKNPSLSITWI